VAAEPGDLGAVRLADGRTVEYWAGGDPSGRPVVFLPGTPNSRRQGVHGHEAAVATGVRLLALSRPGYGGSTNTPPSLAGVGADVAQVAGLLGVDRFSVLGMSGGGPYAVASALAAPDRVQALGVLAGVGPWTELDPPTGTDAEERRWLAEAVAGHPARALGHFLDSAHRAFDSMLALPDEAMLDVFFAGAPAGDIDRSDVAARRRWARDLREALTSYHGFARDNVSWGATWDIDPHDVSVPAHLWYGGADLMVPAAHGAWLADQVPDAHLVVRRGEGHGSVTFGHWPETLATLTR
jgi:pimeloyl-ACP methyl ester carboxylesterase